ncbi:hypothetical protein BSP75_03525 [Aeromonas sp. YN13HZO-058]|nr:hypothetical protein BSP75_03525 [Aeromonas sp. YN13HZO-058]
MAQSMMKHREADGSGDDCADGQQKNNRAPAFGRSGCEPSIGASIGSNIGASMVGVSAIRSAAEQAVAHDKGASVAGPFHCG